MPMFFFLGAYIFGNKIRNNQYNDAIKFLKKKSLRLLAPYIMWSLFQLIVFRNTFTLNTICTGSLHLWFLLVLFYYFILFYFIKPLWIKAKPGVLLLALFAALTLSSIINIPTDILCLAAFIHYMPFFIWGLILSGREKKMSNNVFNFVLICLGIILLTVFSSYGLVSSPKNIIIRKLASILTLFGIFYFNPPFDFRCLKKYILSFDENSYGIYLIHHILIWGIVQIPILQHFLDSHTLLSPFCIFIVALLVPWWISNIMRKNKYSRILLGEK